MPLMRHCLPQPMHSFTQDDIAICVKLLALELAPPTDKIENLLDALSKYFCGTDNADAAHAEAKLYKQAYEAKDSTISSCCQTHC